MANFDLMSVKKKMLRKYPTFGSTINSVNYQIVNQGHPVSTAGTDGRTIYINSEYMQSLSESEQVFTLSHEVCHIALNHIMRSKGKDSNLWNIATDAVINQYLQQDGLSMPKGGVDIKDALNYNAEEYYSKLLAEQQKDSKKQQKKNPKQNVGHDDHTMWQNSETQTESQQQKIKNNYQQQNDAQNIKEKEVFNRNKAERIRQAQELMKKINSARRGVEDNTRFVEFSNIGEESKPIINWKRKLIKTLEIEDETWGHKFSTKSNGYRARIEDVEYENQAQTEIILDVSGSVSEDLLRGFLRQVKTILKSSVIKVGTFSDQFNGWIDIKKNTDIDNINIRIGGGTNYDSASKAFSKRKDVNKICFTDGDEDQAELVKEPRNDIIWVSFHNPNFKPDNGKVIFVSPQDVQKLIVSEQREKEPELEM